jgi:hypothetical protein
MIAVSFEISTIATKLTR